MHNLISLPQNDRHGVSKSNPPLEGFLLTTAMFSFITKGMMSQSKNIRDYRVRLGVISFGPLNAITDTEGVQVGHTTLILNSLFQAETTTGIGSYHGFSTS